MRALYFSLCIIVVTALPPRQFRRVPEKKLEPTERKIEATPDVKIEVKTPLEENVPAKEKDIEPEVPSLRSYYENQSHVVSTTTTYTQDKQVNIGSPHVHIGRPQINSNNMPPMYLAQAPASVQAPMQVSVREPPYRGPHKEENDAKNVYTVNVYVNFPAEEKQQNESEDDGEWFKNKDGDKNKASDKCKDGQLRVKGVCVDRH